MGSGPAPRRATAAHAMTALLATTLLGCATGHPTPADATATAPTARPTTDRDLCAALITHWAGVVLDAGEDRDAVRLDYQAMGLSGGQNDILRAVLDAARAEQRARGREAARELATRQADLRCAERYRSGAPTGGPWQ